MTPVRWLSWLVVVAGLVLGAALDHPPARQGGIRVSEQETLLVADFHVHAFPGDGILPPWEVAREGRRRGLDVVALTSHNQLWAAKLASLAAPVDGDPLIITGQEITAAGFHMAGVGLSRPVDWRLPASAVIDAVHEQGGAAIAAHPRRQFWPAFDPAAMRKLDGAELQHPLIEEEPEAGGELRAFYDAVKAHNPRLAAIGSSDFHFGAVMGRCRTYLIAREGSREGVVEAIRQGRTVAADAAGNLYGDDAMVSQVNAILATSPPVAERAGTHVFAAVLVLVGLTLVVLFR